jgi:hypothetical protein
MARFNEILAGRYNRFLQKLFVLKGGPPAPQLSSEIGVGIVLFNGVENRYLETWDRFGQGVNVAAAATFLSGIRLRNPPGSNVIAVLERVGFSETLADVIAVRWGTATTDLATLQGGVGNRLDARQRPNPTLILSSQNTAATVPALTGQFTIEAPDIPAKTPVQLLAFEDQELTMLPGDAMQLEASTVNQNLRGFFWWRERALEESERF